MEKTAEQNNLLKYIKVEGLPSGDIRMETICRPATTEQTISPRAKLCFQKVFCEDWRMSARMFDALWADFEKELSGY